jgi:hypothetical protein
MYQTPQSIWNEIAKTQPMATEVWHRLARLPVDKLPDAIDAAVYQPLEAAGYTENRVLRAFITVAPLLAENLAISRYIEATGRESLRSSMPELVSVREATTLASEEFSLTPSQAIKLHRALLRFPALSTSAEPSATPSASR